MILQYTAHATDDVLGFCAEDDVPSPPPDPEAPLQPSMCYVVFRTNGRVAWRATSVDALDTFIERSGVGELTISNDLIATKLSTGTLAVSEGSNARMGVATLVAGTVTVNTNKVTANSRIFLTHQNSSGVTIGTVYISARTPGTSFTITGLVTDISTIAWLLVEPA